MKIIRKIPRVLGASNRCYITAVNRTTEKCITMNPIIYTELSL